jgi:hypothetical protein
MAENFDIAKFLKENSLGSYGILGNYVDLKPLKEDDNPKPKSTYVTDWSEDDKGWSVSGDGDGKNDQYDGEYDDESGPAMANELEKPEQIYTNDWMNDSIDGKKVGDWTCYYEDFQDVIYWIHDKINSEDAVVYATPGWDGAKGIACETSVDSGEAVIDHETIGDNSYPDFESYADAVKPYLDKVEAKYLGMGNEMSEEVSVSSSGVEMEEAQDYEYTSAEEFDLEPQEGPNDPLGPDAPKYPRADFADAVYKANRLGGLSKDELIILVNQNAK